LTDPEPISVRDASEWPQIVVRRPDVSSHVPDRVSDLRSTGRLQPCQGLQRLPVERDPHAQSFANSEVFGKGKFLK
jgi:hypothetical protein